MQRARGGDAGVTLMEVVIGMAVFTVLAGSVLGVLVRTVDLSRRNTERVVASNIANQQIEATRSKRALDIPNGGRVSTAVVNGTTFTVTQTANFVSDTAGGGSLCTGSSNDLPYKLVTVRVTWPNMGTVQPVRSDTLKAVGFGDLDATRATLALSVLTATGAPAGNIAVTVTNSSSAVVGTVTTGEDGCAVFTGLAAGTYAASVNTAGYVGTANAQAASVSNFGAVAGEVRRATLSYDTSRELLTTVSAPAGGYVAPTTPFPLSLRSSALTDRVLPSCASVTAQGCSTGFPGTLRYLFPAVYDIYAGTCSDAKANAQLVDLTASSSSGTTAQVAVGGVHVDVKQGTTNLAGRVVTARHANETVAPGSAGCASGETYQFVPTTTSGVNSMLPFGTWQLSTPGGTATQSVTVTRSAPTATATLTVP